MKLIVRLLFIWMIFCAKVLSSPGRVKIIGGISKAQLPTAEAYWKASAYQLGSTWLKDLNGKGHHLRLGSTAQAEILDRALIHPGVSGNYAMSPDHVDARVTGDIDLRWYGFFNSFSGMALFRKWTSSGNQRGYAPNVQSGKVLRLYYSVNGSTTLNADATVPHTLAEGEFGWLRIIREASTGIVRFYESRGGVFWDKLGDDVVGTAGNLHASTSPIYIGSNELGTGELLSGGTRRVVVKNGIDGITVFDADFTKQSDQTVYFKEATGKPVFVKAPSARIMGGALVSPGTNGNYASSPDHADLDVVGDIDLRWYGAPDTWVHSISRTLFGKFVASGNQRSYLFRLEADGKLKLYLSNDGVATTPNATSDAWALPGDGESKWLRVTWRVSDGRVQFFRSDTGLDGSWTQIGVDKSIAMAGIFSSSAALEVGSNNTGTDVPFPGRIFRAIVKDGIDGTTVFDVDFTDKPGRTPGIGGDQQIKDATGKVVTINTSGGPWDTNKPAFLKYDGTKYAYLPGTDGNVASVPDEAALDITGDIDLRWFGSLDDWTPGSYNTLIGKAAGVSAAQPYALVIANASGGSAGRVQLNLDGGSGEVSTTSTEAVQAADGELKWIRATWQQSDGRVQFFTSEDGIAWDQLGTDRSLTTVAAINTSAGPLEIGRYHQNSLFLAGRTYRAQVFAGLAGTDKRLDVDFNDADASATTFLAKTGQVVTLNRSATGRKLAIVDEDKFLFGTDDFAELANHAGVDFDADDSFSVSAAFRIFGTAQSAIVDKGRWSALMNRSGNPDRWGFVLSDGAIANDFHSVGTVLTPAALNAATTTVDRVDQVLKSYDDGVHLGTSNSISNVGSPSNTGVLRIGKDQLGNNIAAMEFVSGAIHRRAITAGEQMIQLSNELKAAV